MKIPLQLAIEVNVMRSVGYPWELKGHVFKPMRPKRDEVDLGWGTFDSDVNPSELLTDFLKIPRNDNAAMLEFLNATGAWEEWDEPVNAYYLWNKQDAVRSIVSERTSDSLATNLLEEELDGLRVPTQFEVSNKYKMAGLTVELPSTWSTILFACWSERARGITRRNCARYDCADFGAGRAMFEITRPDKRYCST